ncbi:MAG: outer membrane beta-barrel protein [Gammaproteobacteria bacterium]|nr:outer membrane beta-barrel protein [Gammaproteobacteria bacterium]
MKTLRHLISIAALTLPVVCTADGTGFFGGVGIGGSRAEGKIDKIGVSPPMNESIVSNDFKESDVSWKVFAGYRFIENFGIEVGYIDLGKPEGSFCFTDNPPIGSQCEGREWDVSVEVDGWNIDAVGILPLGSNWEVFAKLGVYAWDGEARGIDRVNAAPGRPIPPGTTAAVDADGEDLRVGFGGSLRVAERISLRAEFEWFDVGVVDDLWAINFSIVFGAGGKSEK